jgi:uncharacterized integral membrane protein
LTQIGQYSYILLAAVLVMILIVAGAFAFLLIKAFTQQTATRVEKYKTHWTMQAPLIILLVSLIGIEVYLSTGLSALLQTITASLGF